MRLFRRRPAEPEAPTFSVGVDGHRVVIGGRVAGCEMLTDVDAYVGPVAARAQASADGRDPVALQSAKMDYTEMVESMISVLGLALEELEERAVVNLTDVPARPALPGLDRNLSTYDYIQAAYARAQRRCEWARSVDALLRERGVAVLWPPQQRD